MGNECKACRKRNPEEELILNAPIQKNSESETIDNSKSSQKYQTFKEIINSNPEHYKKLLKRKFLGEVNAYGGNERKRIEKRTQ